VRDFKRRVILTDSVSWALKLGVPLSALRLDASANAQSRQPVASAVALDDWPMDDDDANDAQKSWNCPPSINVKSTGASGDGEIDDSAAFQEALAKGKAVFVPPGIYRIGTQLHLDGATIFGAGPQSILKCNNAEFNLFNVAGTSSRIQNIAIWGAATSLTTSQFAVVTSTSNPPNDFSVGGVTFTGPTDSTGLNNGIKFDDGATNCRVHDCHFDRLIGDKRNGYGILTGTVDGLVVSGNTFQGSRSRGQGRHAIYASAAARRVVASHNVIRDFNYEAMATNAYQHHDAVEQLIFSHNIIYQCGGLGENQSSICIAGRAKTIRVEGNIVLESFGCGILCDAGSVIQENICVDGNTVIDANYFGIRQVGALQQTVRNNYVRGSSRVEAKRWADIVVGSGGLLAPIQVLVSGNQCVAAAARSYRPFVLNSTQPMPISVTVAGNDFPSAGYVAGPDYGPARQNCVIDGRRQLSVDLKPSLLEAGAWKDVFIDLAAVGEDDVTVGNCAPASAGLMVGTGVVGADRIVVRLTNLSDQRLELRGRKIVVDVWKRSG
jgi:hypothetical protein